MPQRHCRACNGWHDLSEPWPAECRSHFRQIRGPASEHVAAPMVISDNIELRSMADGSMYTSKRGYYRSLKEKGCEIVEGRTDDLIPEGPNRPREPKSDVGQDVKQAWDALSG